MADLLTFLNTSDPETLTRVPGITRAIADNIAAARPFDTVEDCLKVKGMGKALMARLQQYAEAQENESESRDMLPVPQEAEEPKEKEPQMEESTPEGESFPSRMGKAFLIFLKALVRLVMIVALFLVVGAALYYGLPYINKTLIAPVEQNTAEISRLESEIEALQTQLDETNQRLDLLAQSVETHTNSIKKLEQMQAELETALQENHDEVLLTLKHEVMFTRTLDTLARARLYLAQSNFGLAKEDVQAARDLLVELQNEKPDAALDQSIQRLDLALNNLPQFPVVAAGDLEIAWQILMTGQQEMNETTVPDGNTTPQPTPEAAATPQATPNP